MNALGKGLEFVSKMATWASEHLNILIPVIKVLGAAFLGYTVAANAATFATKALTVVFRVLLALSSINPFGLIFKVVIQR